MPTAASLSLVDLLVARDWDGGGSLNVDSSDSSSVSEQLITEWLGSQEAFPSLTLLVRLESCGPTSQLSSVDKRGSITDVASLMLKKPRSPAEVIIPINDCCNEESI
ncbi:hypothetical protein Efla_007747 [Eimeria flavescens]